MTKAIYSFLLLLATFLLPFLNTDAAEEKNHSLLPAPAPIAANLNNSSPAPLNQFLSNTWPSTNLQPAESSTASNTTPSSEPFSSLINQLVAQNFAEPSGAFGPAFNQILNSIDDQTSNNQTYDGLRQFWHVDILNSVTSTGSFIANFINNLTSIYLPYLVGCLCAIVKSFFLNTDLTAVQDSAATNDLSNMLSQLANTIYGIALDLSLLLFILSIWRYWTQSAWHGSGSPMSAVGRLIATIALMLSWTTIYKFQISLSNEMLSALFPDSTGQIQFFDLIMASLLHKTSTYPTTAGLLAAVPATEYVPAASGIMQGIVALAPIVASVIVVFLAIVLIYELLYLIVLKAIQTSLLTAQFVFAPFFLVFLSNPVTDNIASSFLRSFVEVSLWNFIWIGLLKVLIILLFSNFNPWGKILTTIGVLQLMMQVPQFLAHAKISMASDFVSPHFFAKALKDISGYDDKIKTGTETLRQFFTGTSAHPHHKEKSPASAAKKDNFSFAGNDGPNNAVQPPPKFTHLNGQSNNNNSAQNNNPEENKAAGYGSFATGSTGTAGFASATNLTTGGSFAYASAASMANALSIAIATITNSPGNDSPGSPRPDPNPAKPGPPNPESGRSGPKPSPSNPDTGNGPSSLPPPPKPNPPNSNPEFGSSFGTNLSSSPSPLKPYFPPPSTDINGWHGPPKKPDPGAGPQTELSPSADQNSMLGKVHILPSSKSKGETRKIAHRDSLATNTPGNPSLTSDSRLISNSPLSSNSELSSNSGPSSDYQLPALQLTAGDAGEIANLTSPKIALNQTHAFHNGAFNYHLIKKGSRSSRLSSFFYNPLRSFGASEGAFGHYAYNLIFTHGNSPPLMGIPPIYPAPN